MSRCWTTDVQPSPDSYAASSKVMGISEVLFSLLREEVGRRIALWICVENQNSLLHFNR